MKGDVMTKALLIIVAMLLGVALMLYGGSTQSVTAQEGKTQIGRYQISAWAAQAGARTHHAGYYVLDTVTGKIIDRGAEVHTTEKAEDVIRTPE
ncbi:MAG: hypothetical protein JSV13_05515 [Nitrospiraceae bacterium]|nr:MAG: hypothetical protein JSV13_05515 [Nitrospiraceae bacterium]